MSEEITKIITTNNLLSDIINESNELTNQSKDELTNQDLTKENNLVDLLLKLDLSLLSVIEKDILMSLLTSNPMYFNDAEGILSKMIRDNNIDVMDIPLLIDLLKKLFEIIYNLKNKSLKTNDISNITTNIFKLIIHTLIENKKLNLDNTTNINNLIDSLSSLIKLKKTLKQNKTTCFFRIK